MSPPDVRQASEIGTGVQNNLHSSDGETRVLALLHVETLERGELILGEVSSSNVIITIIIIIIINIIINIIIIIVINIIIIIINVIVIIVIIIIITNHHHRAGTVSLGEYLREVPVRHVHSSSNLQISQPDTLAQDQPHVVWVTVTGYLQSL